MHELEMEYFANKVQIFFFQKNVGVNEKSFELLY
jgi:hypothetical protein